MIIMIWQFRAVTQQDVCSQHAARVMLTYCKGQEQLSLIHVGFGQLAVLMVCASSY